MKSLLEDSVKLSYPGMRLQESSLTIRKRTTARVSAAFKGGGQIYAHLGALIDSPMEIFFVGWIAGGFMVLLGLVLSDRYDLAASASLVWLCGVFLTATAVLKEFLPRS